MLPSKYNHLIVQLVLNSFAKNRKNVESLLKQNKIEYDKKNTTYLKKGVIKLKTEYELNLSPSKIDINFIIADK